MKVPEDIRQDIFNKFKCGLTHKQLAKAYNIPYSTVRYIISKKIKR